MTQLQRYYQRAPRYILIPEDDFLVRVAGPKQIPWEEGTEIMNISGTGLAFTAPVYLAPNIGEHIKIQFSVPNSGQMAAFAQVTRIDAWSDERVLVAIKFEYMDWAQQIYLRQGLANKLRSQIEKVEASNKHPMQWLLSATLIANIFFTSILLFMIYYTLSRFTWGELGTLIWSYF